MPQDFSQQYYMVIDEKSSGPFTLDEVILHSKLTPNTLVWKPGLDNWVAAKTLPEISIAFSQADNQGDAPKPPHYQNPQDSGNNQFQENNPYNSDPRNYGKRDEQGFGNNNFDNTQAPYNTNSDYNRFADNPQYNSNHSYNHHHQNPYYNHRNQYNNQNNYRPNIRTNWLAWAIVATVVGFFTSCIGAIFGIIGIVQANKANTLYAQGFDREADAANSNAKVMTIIGLVFAGIGIIAALWFGNLFNSIYNLSYL